LHINSKDTKVLESPFPTATMAQEFGITNDAAMSFSFETETDGMEITELLYVHEEFFKCYSKAAAQEAIVSDCVFLVRKTECVSCIIYSLQLLPLSYYAYHEIQSYYPNSRINTVYFSRNSTIRINTNA
jgi:hypothetical protein